MKLILPLLLSSFLSFGQRQERKLIIYNLGFGGLTSGIGAVINKPKHGRWQHFLLKGLWQGSMGGLLQYSGKKSLYLVNRNKKLTFAWPAKILHDAGTSILENAALNRPMFKNWNVNYGPFRFDFSFGSNREFKIRFLPISIYSVIQGVSLGHFDVKTTLFTGNLTFKDVTLSSRSANGISTGRAFVYTNDNERYHYISHETIHQFQFDEYQSLNAWLNPLIGHVKSDRIKNIFNKYIYFDIPYYWPFYGMEGNFEIRRYYRNLYEFEAERFSTNAYVPVH